MIVHLREARLEDVAADIVEINVDAVRRRGLERLEDIAFLVVDRGIEAEFGREPAALFLAAGDTDDAAALDPGDLADDRTHRARGGGNYHGLAGLRLADVEQAEIGGQPGDAVHAEQIGHRLDLRQFAQMPGRYRRVVLPVRIAEQEV